MKPVEFSGAIDPAICDSIISEFEQSIAITIRDRPEYKFKEILMYDGSQEMRNCEMVLVNSAIHHFTRFRLENNITTFPGRMGFEAVRVKRYDAGDEFPWHVDVRDYASAKRFLVCMFYLNDDFDGGNTEFGSEHEIKLTIAPEKGKLVLFTPFWDNPHRGCKVLSGSKYIANVYLHYQ